MYGTYSMRNPLFSQLKGKGMEGEQKVFLRCFGADQKIASS